jgi:hypothetical protein
MRPARLQASKVASQLRIELPADLLEVAATQGLRPDVLLSYLRYAQARMRRRRRNRRAPCALPSAPLALPAAWDAARGRTAATPRAQRAHCARWPQAAARAASQRIVKPSNYQLRISAALMLCYLTHQVGLLASLMAAAPFVRDRMLADERFLFKARAALTVARARKRALSRLRCAGGHRGGHRRGAGHVRGAAAAQRQLLGRG